MLKDLTSFFRFQTDLAGDPRKETTHGGRVQFLLLENPEKKIFPSVMVERNGFIESMLSGTDHHNHDYRYMGDRASTKYIKVD